MSVRCGICGCTLRKGRCFECALQARRLRARDIVQKFAEVIDKEDSQTRSYVMKELRRRYSRLKVIV